MYLYIYSPLFCQQGKTDMLYSIQGILQALEYLLIKGYVPRRGFYIGLGHDEEVLTFL